jgi:hypothetical protein
MADQKTLVIDGFEVKEIIHLGNSFGESSRAYRLGNDGGIALSSPSWLKEAFPFLEGQYPVASDPLGGTCLVVPSGPTADSLLQFEVCEAA